MSQSVSPGAETTQQSIQKSGSPGAGTTLVLILYVKYMMADITRQKNLLPHRIEATSVIENGFKHQQAMSMFQQKRGRVMHTDGNIEDDWFHWAQILTGYILDWSRSLAPFFFVAAGAFKLLLTSLMHRPR
jgi:hypothetical protein